MAAESLLPLDAVLLSHDHHFDNLDHAGRHLLSSAARVLTTAEGAARVGSESGLVPWQSSSLETRGGAPLRITATPARQGADGRDHGVRRCPAGKGRAQWPRDHRRSASLSRGWSSHDHHPQ